MLEPKSIYPGNSAAWYAGHDANGDGIGEDLSVGYTCRLRVIGTAVDRAVTTLVADGSGNANRRFLVALTPAETTALVAADYIVVIDIANASANWAATDEGKLTILSVPAAEPTELDRLKELRAALQAAQLAAVGGSVQEVWNGRYGNKMKYVTMTYNQIKAALEDVNRMIADEERVAAGGSRRGGGVGIVWAH